jgi:hypothetical protein
MKLNAEDRRIKREERELVKKELERKAKLLREERQKLITVFGINPYKEPESKKTGPQGKTSPNSLANQIAESKRKAEEARKKKQDENNEKVVADAFKPEPKLEPEHKQEPPVEPVAVSEDKPTESPPPESDRKSSVQSFIEKSERNSMEQDVKIGTLEAKIKEIEEKVDMQRAYGYSKSSVMTGLPKGDYEYQTLRWYDATKTWKPDWLRAH